MYEKGLGFIQDGIIDQHFIVRSRYNRLITAMADYPGLWGMGVDEATAVWIQGNHAEVVGESQVVHISPFEVRGESPVKWGGLSGQITFYRSGDRFLCVNRPLIMARNKKRIISFYYRRISYASAF